MAELLLELFSEEIPARMQARAAEDLRRLVTEGLKAQGLAAGEARAYATPRRLALVVEGVPAKSPDVSEERKGPRVNAPEQAIAGFIKSAGLDSIRDAHVVKDEKKGDFYVVRIAKPGRAAKEIIGEVVPAVAAKFPWPKSMRWGAGRTSWVRPLHSIVCVLDGKVVPLAIEEVEAGKQTRGHRFHGDEPFEVSGAADYVKALKAHKVILDPAERSGLIAEQARALAKEHKLALVEDEALLAENAGLTEWPLVLMGSFEEAFLEVPAECLMLSMKQHQKCFSLKHPRSGKLANRFLLVSNLDAEGRRGADHRRQREGDPRAAGGRQILLGAGPQEAARRDGKRARRHHLPREAGQPEGARGAHRRAGLPDRGLGGCGARGRTARGAAGQGRSGVRHGGRVPRVAGPDGALLRRGRRHQARDRPRHRAALQAQGADRHGAAGVAGRRRGYRRGPGRQARHARWLLGHRREADGQR